MTNRTRTGLSAMTNMRSTRVTVTAFFSAAMLAISIDCGHPSSPTAPTALTQSPPSPPGPVPATTTVPPANNGEIGVYRSDVAMSRSGTATVTLTWPDADFSLRLYLTRGVCADARSLVAGECSVLGSTRPGRLPGIVTSPVIAGDVTTIWVLNPDPFPQTFNVYIFVE
jgi:hypothetical protein